MLRRTLLSALLLAMTVQAMAGGKRVLFIGDSITDGAWGNSNVWNASSDERDQHDMNHIYGHGYMLLVAARYQALYPTQGWTFWNRGISGNTLTDLAGRWQQDVLDLQPDVVSVLVGTNDVEQALNEGRTIDVDAWSQQYRSLLDQVRQQNPDVRLVLCTPFVAAVGWRGEHQDYPLRSQMIASLTAVIQALCHEYHATLVPFHQLVADTILSTPDLPASYWIWDGIHPTPAMHYLMAEMWIQEVII